MLKLYRMSIGNDSCRDGDRETESFAGDVTAGMAASVSSPSRLRIQSSTSFVNVDRSKRELPTLVGYEKCPCDTVLDDFVNTSMAARFLISTVEEKARLARC